MKQNHGRNLPNSKYEFANTTSQQQSQLVQKNQAVQARVAKRNIEFLWSSGNGHFIMFQIKKTNPIY
ncbi:hypothetical protein BIY22_17280 [Vibrio panuliri]|uniref:Uncharacterized protein n=1 Tax=Vibrio panuliri TaxID=1381081 RepID=A0A1Q9HM33_9VIBR|nr:hypothetical protein BIY22_17280 [Vibrio panuliri]OLQ94779.1 hypothetical protein BIY20_00360 [Vibrio panuliri]